MDIEEEIVICVGDVTFSLEKDCGLEYEQKALKELRETPENVEKGIKELRDLILAENVINIPIEKENFLLIFLRRNKYYAQSAYDNIKRLFKFQRNHPEYYGNLLPSSERNIFLQPVLTILPLRDQNGCRLLLIEAGSKWNTKICTLPEIVRGLILMLQAALLEIRSQISGVQVIIDTEGLGLSHVMQFTPSSAKAITDWVQDCIPIRVKGIHVLNQPIIVNMIFQLFKPFLREKFAKRIHFHGKDFKSLKQFICSKSLPLQYGGDFTMPKCLPREEIYNMMCKYESLYQEYFSYGFKQ